MSFVVFSVLTIFLHYCTMECGSGRQHS